MGMIKKILGGLVVLVLVLIVVGVVVVLNLGAIVKAGVQKGGTAVLGVPTKLDSASVSVLGGSAELRGLTLGSPKGFKADEMFGMDRASMGVDIWSLRSDQIVVREIEVEGLDVTLEFAGGTTNWQVIMEELEARKAEEEEEADAGPPRKSIRIDRIEFTGGELHLVGAPLDAGGTVSLPAFTVTDLKTPGGEGLTMAETLDRIVDSLYAEITGSLEERMPDVAGELESAMDEARGALNEAGKKVDEAVEEGKRGITGAIEGLFGEDEEED